ncbi:MAG: cytochrome c1 [Pseudomonadota bacterium]
MIKAKILPALIACALAPGAAFAAGADGKTQDVPFSFEGPFGTFDKYQLQRGLQVYHEVCAGCHGLQYLAIRELERSDGPAMPNEQVKALASEYEVPDENGEPGDTREAKPSDKFPANNAVGAPDLTLMAKARAGFKGPMGLGINQLMKGIGGPEYIYSILMGYTGEENEVAGSILYENTAMAGGWISMAPPLSDDLVEYAVYGDAPEDGEEGYQAPPATADQMARDVSAFLMWAAEPHMIERKEAGFRNLMMVILLAVLLYFTNKKLWAPIKRKESSA